MKTTYSARFFIHMVVLALFLPLALWPAPAQAVPPVPGSFWGTVTQGGTNYPDGTTVSAWIGGVKYKETATLTYNNVSYYSLDIDGDDPDTPNVKEGGTDGDSIVFKVNGENAEQTGIWHSNSSQLDLTVPQPIATLDAVAPVVSDQGATLNVTITGSNTHFATGSTTVSFGADIVVNSVTATNATQLVVEISIANSATQHRTVTVTTGAEVISQESSFTVRGAGINIHAPTGATGVLGAQAVLPISIPDTVDGQNILSYQFQLTFDPAVLQFVGVSKIGTLSAGWSVVSNDDTPGQASVVAYNTTPLAGNGTLVDMLFNVISVSQTDLSFANFTFNDGNPGRTTHDGHFVATDLSIGGKVTYASGETFVPDVQVALAGPSTDIHTTDSSGVYHFPAIAFGNYSLTPDKQSDFRTAIHALDASYIAQCLVENRPAADCAIEASDVSGNNQIEAFDAALIARYVVGLTTNPSSNTGQWVFSPPAYIYQPLSASQPNENFAAYLKGDVTGNWVDNAVFSSAQPTDVVQMTLSSPSASGNQVNTNVHLTNVPPGEVFAYEMTIEYDPASLEFVDLIAGQAVGADWNIVYNDLEAGIVRVAGYGAEAIEADGDLLELYFHQLGQGGSIQITTAQLNEGSPPVEIGVDVSLNLYTVLLPIITQ